MGFWDSLFGVSRPVAQPSAPARRRPPTDDEYAVDRYRYLLRTAPPADVERVHAEAFAKLTPEQRRLLHEQLSAAVMLEERPADDEPDTLARAATRAELQQPGTVERVLAGPSFGQTFGSSLLGTVAGYVVASSLMSMFLPSGDALYPDGYQDGYADGQDPSALGDTGYDDGGDFGGDLGGFDF